jgi:hypothetical protein
MLLPGRETTELDGLDPKACLTNVVDHMAKNIL